MICGNAGIVYVEIFAVKLIPFLRNPINIYSFSFFRYIQDKVRRSFNQHPYCNQTGNPGCMGELMPEILPKDTIKDGFCPDTYQFPMFTKQFCTEMIEEAEWADDWFKSGNDTVYDDR